jgi:hypothetical protein
MVEGQEPSAREKPFYKTELLPQSLSSFCSSYYRQRTVMEQIPDWIPATTLVLALASLVYVSKVEER